MAEETKGGPPKPPPTRPPSPLQEDVGKRHIPTRDSPTPPRVTNTVPAPPVRPKK